jgi:predicted unusual protein kinase regulating ubiquinone biosynthesis (AarF/ABC1/UbiB family)
MGKEDKQNKIPTSKVKRAAKIMGASAKVGGNYVKYYAKKVVNPSTSKDSLHKDNAEDIYNSLSELKGSALKVAQMMSMDNQMLPQAYQDKFSMAQYSAPALSFPLISKTFVQQLGKKPHDIFDDFSKDAVNAASIGQVHKAKIKEHIYAVKIQYPGVADAISSDLKLVKPLAGKLLNMKSADMEMYMSEVESKMIEETDYALELNRSTFISEKCSFISNLKFPKYYKEYSANRVLTMDWMDGKMFPDFIKTNPSQEVRNQVGQAMWDFFLYQMKELRMVHADPHPGNFIVDHSNNLCVLDFGCVKEIPEDFFNNYFQLLRPDILEQPNLLNEVYVNMDFFRPDDTEKQKEKLKAMFQEIIGLLAKPFHNAVFDFGDNSYFTKIYTMGEGFSKDKEFRKMNNARGSRHAIYVMRTFFGLYSLLNQLKAKVNMNYQLY